MEPLFSLDIGTRTVVGLVSVLEDGIYKVVDHEIMSHPERAMFDGQIHDIEKVTRVVERVKMTLEERTGYTFKKVAIAAAGRALKTVKTTVHRHLDIGQSISQELINNVEMEGIQEAQATIEKEQQTKVGHYYCVGYNVCQYYIDDIMNINPRDHRGDKLTITLIATFLPHIVVDSLYTVVDRAGLEVQNMTLEPIAAINIAIPANLRLLNLALVDIGAGTSDIAITKDGTVISFGMVASAGDKFTEAIAKHYLLDFDQAEALKMDLNQKEDHTFLDIIGMSHRVTTAEVVKTIESVYLETASKVADQILTYNEKPPSAVFCIGGGSQIPDFTKYLAQALDLPHERVVIKPVEVLDKIEFDKQALEGPAFITPLGIGLTALKEKEKDFLQIMVNDKSVRLLNAKTLSVSDALILVGYHARALLPERGRSLKYTLNGQEKTLRGGYGEAAEIFVNGKKASLDVPLKHKDQIHVKEGLRGEDAKADLHEILKPFRFIFNDEKIDDIYNYSVNGNKSHYDQALVNGDVIHVDRYKSVGDILKYKGIEGDHLRVYVNGQRVSHDKVIEASDIIRTRWEEEKEDVLSIKRPDFMTKEEEESLQTEAFSYEVEVENKEEPILDDQTYSYGLLVNNDPVHIKEVKRKMVFVDIFDHINFDISKPQGILQLRLNGRKANYTDELKDGDVIEIKWQ